ncbi:DNA recombination protein RmuC homolog [Triticum aestivum]|uniref:DNA recombination protein RmuC homolog n=1 Tax=Triticum aestivum TaxID=4565 RepID=UPI001D025FEE|nr:DNA recombination protein RmuC homolog [Triticum aestivum]
MERREDPVIFVEEASQTAPTGAGQSVQSAAAPEQPSRGEPAAGAGLELSRAQASLRAKEAEYSALVLERDRLVKKLADQEESHKEALKKAQDNEDALKAEFETEAAGWAEAKQALSEGFSRIEDLIDDYFPGYSVFATQSIEAHREVRREAGAMQAALADIEVLSFKRG